MQVDIVSGEVVNHERIHSTFGCSTMGGMNYSTKTNTLVLVSNHVESIYEDKWIDDVLYYTGMGTKGDQTLSSQNRRLAESDTNGVEVHLFEVFRKTEYTYRGVVKLADSPYQSEQTDSENNLRKVWIFPLKLINQAAPILEEHFMEAEQKRKNTAKKEAQKLTYEELCQRAQKESKTPGTVEVKSKRYQRNLYLVELVKQNANGACQLCGNQAPFKVKGVPYLEVHHIVPLAEGGSDSLDNTVALCPNCHRKMHALGLKEDEQKLKNLAQNFTASSKAN